MKRFIRKRAGRILVGTGLSLAGIGLLSKANDEGKLTGTTHLYHGTTKKRIPKILKEGIKTSRAKDPDTLLSDVYSKDYIPEDSNVYLAKNRSMAEGVNKTRHSVRRPGKVYNTPEDFEKDVKKRSQVLDIDIPRTVFKKMTRNQNPELLGAKDRKDFIKKYREKNKKKIEEGGGVSDWELSDAYNQLSDKNTVTLGNDIDPEYIRGSEKYNQSRWKNFKDNAKNNRAEFLGALGKAGLGAAGLGLGARMIFKK